MKNKTSFLLLSILWLSGCAFIQPEKRHSPAEIASYGINSFVAPLASADGERTAGESGIEKIRLATAEGRRDGDVAEALDVVAFMNTDRERMRNLLLHQLRCAFHRI